MKLAIEYLKGPEVVVGCVVGFSHGNNSLEVKVFDIQQTCNVGTAVNDRLIFIEKQLGGDWLDIENEIKIITNLVITTKPQ